MQIALFLENKKSWLSCICCFFIIFARSIFGSPTSVFPEDDDECAAQSQNLCSERNHICLELNKCDTLDYSDPNLIIEYCNKHCGIVCCPMPENSSPDIRPRGPEKPDQTRAERACDEYQQMRIMSNQTCPEGLIFKGEKAQPGEFPSAALLGIENGSTMPRWLCGGTLITELYVLTAAHCFRLGEIDVVRLGELDYNSSSNNAQDFRVNHSLMHEFYNLGRQANDIALVKLNRTVTFSTNVFPACLPSVNVEYNRFEAVGWGEIAPDNFSSHLMKLEMQLVDATTCLLTDVAQNGLQNDTQFCAKHPIQNDTDTCKGDSGSPLLAIHPEYGCMRVVVGIISFGSVNCGEGKPTVNTNVSAYIKWIERVIWDIQHLH